MPRKGCHEIIDQSGFDFWSWKGVGAECFQSSMDTAADHVTVAVTITLGLLVIEGHFERKKKYTCEHLAREAQTPRMCYFRLLSRGRTCRSVLLLHQTERERMGQYTMFCVQPKVH